MNLKQWENWVVTLATEVTEANGTDSLPWRLVRRPALLIEVRRNRPQAQVHSPSLWTHDSDIKIYMGSPVKNTNSFLSRASPCLLSLWKLLFSLGYRLPSENEAGFWSLTPYLAGLWTCPCHSLTVQLWWYTSIMQPLGMCREEDQSSSSSLATQLVWE